MRAWLHCIAGVVGLVLAVGLASGVARRDGEAPWAGEAPAEPMGRWSVEPRVLRAGQESTITFRYVNGAEPLPPGSAFLMDVEPISVVQLQYGPVSETIEPDPGAPGSSRAAVTLGRPDDRGFLPARIVLPDGVPSGGSVVLRFGNKQVDGRVVALANPTPVTDLAWNVRYAADPAGRPNDVADWRDRGWWRALPRVSIVAGSAAALRITAPSSVAVGKPFGIRIAVTDSLDSRAAPAFVGTVRLEAPAGLVGLPATVRFAASDDSTRILTPVRATRAGVFRIGASLAGGSGAPPARTWESNPIVAGAGVAAVRWGILNGRAGYSEGWGDGADAYFRYGRDVAGLDYLALCEPLAGRASDDDIGRIYACRYGAAARPDAVMKAMLDAAGRSDRPGSFVALPGFAGATAAAGPHGVFWANATPDQVARMVGAGPTAHPFELDGLLGPANALVIHRLNAGYVPYGALGFGRTRSGRPLAPVIECYSDQGMAFPGPGPRDPLLGGVRTAVAKSLFRVVGRGARLGLVGDSGTATGWPGRRYPCGVGIRGRFLQGLTACRTGSFTREGILGAYRARDVYATTGERIYLSFAVAASGMGRTVVADGPLTATVAASGTNAIAEVSLFDGDRVLSQARFSGQRDVRVVFDLPTPKPTETPYMVEVVQVDRQRAWSSPIWVRRRSVPDLRWASGAGGTPVLTNAGPVAARRVVLRGHPSAYGFVRPAWLPEPWAGLDGQVWIRRWTDTRATLFYAWKGEPNDGSLRLQGQVSYEPEPGLSLFDLGYGGAPGGTFDDDRKGLMSFVDGGASFRCMGADVVVSPNRPCVATLTVRRDAAVRIAGRTERGREFRIPINRYGSGAGRTVVLQAVGPGSRVPMTGRGLCWTADPDNAIAESDEGNNLWAPSADR
jgi:hypothetical protein